MKTESIKRHTLKGFRKYFSLRTRLFSDIYKMPYNDCHAEAAFKESMEIVFYLDRAAERLRAELGET